MRSLNQTKPTAQLNRLTSRLLAGHLVAADDEHEKAWLRWAAEDAASIAWSMSYPLLVLPELLQEKLAAARAHFQRQLQIRAHTQNVLRVTE